MNQPKDDVHSLRISIENPWVTHLRYKNNYEDGRFVLFMKVHLILVEKHQHSDYGYYALWPVI